MGKRKRGSNLKSGNGGSSKKSKVVAKQLKRKRPLRLDAPDQSETVKVQQFKESEDINDLIKPFDNALRSRLSDNLDGIKPILIKSNDRPDLKVETILKEDSPAVSCLLLFGSNLAVENTINVGESIKRQWFKTKPGFETINKIFRIPDENGGHMSRICILLIKNSGSVT